MPKKTIGGSGSKAAGAKSKTSPARPLATSTKIPDSKAAATKSKAAARPVRGSRSGRPVMVLLDLLGRRWALRVLWELREGSLHFRALQESMDGVSPAVLNQRLKDLREAGLVELSDAEGYGLSARGRELLVIALPLARWAERWAKARS